MEQTGTRVFVIMDGGLIQNVIAEGPGLVDVVVIDYDTDGAEPDEITMVPQHDYEGNPRGDEPAFVSRWAMSEMEEDRIQDAISDMAERMFGPVA